MSSGLVRFPSDPPRASAALFAARPELGSLEFGFHAEHASSYLRDIGETLPLYTDERIAHPGWLLRSANYVLVANARLGPWIHVSSSVQHHGLVHDGDEVSTRARVIDDFERKGHKFVVLDVVDAREPHPTGDARRAHRHLRTTPLALNDAKIGSG